MRQLTALDTVFLQMENQRQLGHVAGFMVLDPGTAKEPINADTIREYVRARLHLLPPLRWRLVEVPMSIDRPYWNDDPDVDLGYHVRGTALPAPGDDRQLATQIARISSTKLDRARPLWELYVVEGLEGGRVGILTKMHHAAVDGASGMAIMRTLLSPDPDAPPPAPPRRPQVAAPVPRGVDLVTRGLTDALKRPVAVLEQWGALAKETLQGAQMWAQVGRGTFAQLPTGGIPRLSFNAQVSTNRNWVFGRVPLTTVKEIKAGSGATVNDVVMAVCAGALRRWLIAHGELPAGPIYAGVPVSIRSTDNADAMGNQVSGLISALPTHLADPAERLAALHDSMRAAKTVHGALPARSLLGLANFTLPLATEWIARIAADRTVSKRIRVPLNVAISNVPGPRETLYLDGAELLAHYPVSMITDGMGLNITIQSYRDNLDFGLVSTPDLIPDLWDLMGYVRDAAAELHAAVVPGQVPQGASAHDA